MTPRDAASSRPTSAQGPRSAADVTTRSGPIRVSNSVTCSCCTASSRNRHDQAIRRAGDARRQPGECRLRSAREHQPPHPSTGREPDREPLTHITQSDDHHCAHRSILVSPEPWRSIAERGAAGPRAGYRLASVDRLGMLTRAGRLVAPTCRGGVCRCSDWRVWPWAAY